VKMALAKEIVALLGTDDEDTITLFIKQAIRAAEGYRDDRFIDPYLDNMACLIGLQDSAREPL